MECERCGNTATVEHSFPAVDRMHGREAKWSPRCNDCSAYEFELANDTNHHEMEKFGGAYGLVEIEVRPIEAAPIAWNDYQRQALQTAAGSATPDLDHAVLGIAGEAGEIVDALKKHRVYGRPLDTQNVVEELGDLAWYIALACRALDVSFDDCLKANLRKLAKRYPDGKWDAEHCATRDHEAEAAALNG